MHKNKPKKFGYDPKVRGPRARAISHDDLSGESLIIGRNAVAEAIKSGHSIEKIMIQENAGGAASGIVKLAKENGIRIDNVRKSYLEELAPGERHQGVVAIASFHDYAKLEDIFRLAEERGEDPFIVILDGIEDPHNLGAVLRSAECAGCHGVIIPKRNACGLTYTVAKTSAGAVEYVPCVSVTNISRTIEELKKRGVWIYALDMDGEVYSEHDLKGPCAIVIGAEGKGIQRLVKDSCDVTLSIPLKGRIQSLNASNAACVLMYEIRRQRDKA